MMHTSDLMLSRKIKKSNVGKAIRFIIKHAVETRQKRKNIESVVKDCKIVHHCKSFRDNKKRMSTVGFSKSVALLEMQSYIARQDWKHALNLFPKILEYPIELESLVWRYMFIILLHVNDSSHLCEFFKQCIGSRSLNNGASLERLLSLPVKE